MTDRTAQTEGTPGDDGSRGFRAWLRRLFGGAPAAHDPNAPQPGEPMKLVVGLGNMEAKYDGTRHNIGFAVVDALAADHLASFTTSKHQAWTTTITPTSGGKIVLAKPTTLMNRSGLAVRKLVDFYRITPATDLLVVCDDFALDLGHLRLRAKGSHGGQNGLRDIVDKLGGDQQWSRLRCGIGPVPPSSHASHFVLDRFRSGEKADVEDMIERAQMAALTWASDGAEVAQRRYNGNAINSG